MKIFSIFLILTVLSSIFCIELNAKDFYVSINKGRGKKATKKRPAKDLGNIIKKLNPGDTVYIAGGIYLGRGKSGSDIIKVPVKIIGGYDDNFTTRDPWGKYKTILSGDNKSKNWVSNPRLMIDLMKYRKKEMPKILVDGIIIDHAGRNRYKTPKQFMIQRLANPKKGEMPTPDMGGLVIRVSKTSNYQKSWDITVKNCIIMNTAPTQGALSVSGYKGSKNKIINNLIINNTGSGIFAGTKYRPRDNKNKTEFLIENNTVLFTWKYDAVAQSFSGNSIKFDPDTVNVVKNNMFGFADKIGVHNAAKASILLAQNLIIGNVEADYLEFSTKINIEALEDEAECLHEDSIDNVSINDLKIPVSKVWSKLYGSRVMIDRNAMEADIKVQQSRANSLRSILGLPLQAGNIKGASSPVWLNRITIDDAVNAGLNKYKNKYGCQKP